jgi:hypothetical protein
METRSGAAGTPGATATAGTGADATYTVVAAEGTTVNLTSMADQCVEVVGVVAPAAAAARPQAGGAETPAAGAAGARTASANRTLTITTIKAAEGCKP